MPDNNDNAATNDQTTNTNGAKDDQADNGNTRGYTPPATQEDFNRIIDDRLARERAKFADYAALKAKAAKYDEHEQANLSELERANARAEAAERAAQEQAAVTARLNVALDHKLSKDDAALLNDLTDPEAMNRLAARLAAQATQQQDTGVGYRVDNRATPQPDPGNKDAAARAFFGI